MRQIQRERELNVTDQIERVLSKMDDLTERVGDLVKTIAVKEERDHHLDAKLNKAETEITKLKEWRTDVDKVIAGDAARLDIQKMFWRSAIGFAVVTIGAGIVWAIVKMKGG